MGKEKPLQIGLAGLGNVGAGVYKNLIRNRELLRERVGRDLVVRKIVVRDPAKKRDVEIPSEILTTNLEELLEDEEIEVVVELIGGVDEAFSLVKRALEGGKLVVTANKALLAEHGKDLFALAEKHGTTIYFEAAVAGGIPIIKTVQESFVGNHIDEMVGILNGTSNFILTRMREGDLSYEAALEEAQKLGYAEADPTLDVNGADAAHKAVILASLSYGCWIPYEGVFVEGVEKVRRVDIQFAEDYGFALKLVAVIRLAGDDRLEVRVQPSLIAKSHILASVNGVFNAIMVRGDVVGETLFYGSGAGQDPTSSSVISDLVDAASQQNRSGFIPHGLYGTPLPIEETVSQYYLRLLVEDRPGVLAQVASILGEHEVGILSMVQQEGSEEEGAPLFLMLHDAKFGVVREAVDAIGKLPCVRTEPVLMRVEELA